MEETSSHKTMSTDKETENQEFMRTVGGFCYFLTFSFTLRHIISILLISYLFFFTLRRIISYELYWRKNSGIFFSHFNS